MRIPQQMYVLLVQKENYSQWIREAIDEKLIRETDPEFLKQLKEKKYLEIKKIDEQLKKSNEDPEKILEIIQKSYDQFCEKLDKNPMWEIHQMKFWIKNSILPQLKKLRTTKYKDAESVLNTFLKWSGRSA